jgi:hypothetical protein
MFTCALELSSRKKEEIRRIILTALITCLAVGTGAAQSCDSKAVSANGKPFKALLR